MKRILFQTFVSCFILAAAIAVNAAESGKSGTVTYDVALNVRDGAKTASLFLPYPFSDVNQEISDVKVSGNYTSEGIYHDPASGSNYLMAKWNKITEKPRLTMSFHINSHYAKGPKLQAAKGEIPVDMQPYLQANDYLPADNPKVRKLAQDAVKGKKDYLSKARAVYDWTIANTHRDPDVKGCGLGKAIQTLTEANGGGKCADISSVFITIARAAGIPARDVYGLRIPGKDGEITGDFHCWAEFYLPGTGWVMVDPADVRKAMLVEKLEPNDPRTKERTEFFWNGDDLFRMALNRGEHGVRFPGMSGDPVGYFMYPYAEIDGEPLDYFDPKDFVFKVNFKKD